MPVDSKDAQGHTALYMAVHEEYDTLVKLLQNHGAKPVPKDRYALLLLGAVQATEDILQEKKVQQEAAMTEMQNKKRLLMERGEKIAAMAHKASDLQTGADEYNSMAKQLKNTMQQRNSRWGLF